MSALVVDTSSWIAYFAGNGSELVDEALSAGLVRLPPIRGGGASERDAERQRSERTREPAPGSGTLSGRSWTLVPRGWAPRTAEGEGRFGLDSRCARRPVRARYGRGAALRRWGVRADCRPRGASPGGRLMRRREEVRLRRRYEWVIHVP